MLTPDDVRNVVFSGAWRKERGYDEAQVDRFLARIEATLRGKRMVTARDVLTAQFSPRKKGARAYKKAQVDRFLDRVALTLMKLEVRDEDELPRKHRLRSGGEANAFAAPRRKRARAQAEAPEQPAPERPAPEQSAPEQPAVEQPAPETQAAPAGPRRPERPDPEATRRQQPQPPQASPPAPQPSVPAAPPQPVQPVPAAAPQPMQAPAPVPAATPPPGQTPVPAAVPPTAQTPVPAAPPAPVPQTPVPPPAAQTPAPQTAAAPQTMQTPAPAPPNGRATASASEMVRDPARFGALEPAKSLSTALDKAEVDAFMDRVHATLRGADTISSKDVLNAQFNPPRPGMPGYDKEGVLAFLKAVSASIHNITSRNLRPVNPAEVQRNGHANGSNPQLTADQQPTTTIPAVKPDDPPPAAAFPARLSGNLQSGQSASQRG